MSKRKKLMKRIQARCQTDSAFNAKVASAFGMGRLVANLTTPATVSPALKEFCNILSSDTEPIFIFVEPPLWSRCDCCPLNVAKMIQEKGGEALFGYKVWANDIYAEAVPHCIWKDPSGHVHDVTFNPDGEMRILFVPVPSMKQTRFKNGGEKPRYALDPDLRDVVELEALDQENVIYKWKSDEEAWRTQPTYEEWLCKKR